jgi:ABC-2 type transport system ATP-binding protein
MVSDPAILIRALKKTFRRRKEVVVAVDGLDLEVGSGEAFGLLGPNGAGKTTTVEICEGLQQPDSGDVVVLGERWGGGDDRPLRQRIGVSLQQTDFFEKQTVREVLALFASFYDRPRSVEEAIELVALQEKRDARTSSLSGGQRQRLAVATALISRPELLFLDEPTTGLDPQSRRSLWEVAREFLRGGGTLLLTTHYMEEAEQLCHRVGIIDHGRLVAIGTPQELKHRIGGAHVVEVSAQGLAERATSAPWRSWPGVQSDRLEGERLTLTVEAPHRVVPAALQWLQGEGLPLDGLSTRQVSLEDVFVHLTGHQLRDGGP